MIKIKGGTKFLVFVLFVLVFLFEGFVPAAKAEENYPKLVNLFYRWDMTFDEAEQLAKWDVLIIDMDVATYSPQSLRRLKEINPNIKLLAYLASQEIRGDSCKLDGTLRQNLCQRICKNCWLKDRYGRKISWWPGNPIIDVTNASWQKALPKFIEEEIIDPGYWDGVFLDNVWGGITFLNKTVKLQNRYYTSKNKRVDTLWVAGMRKLLSNVKQTLGPNKILIGNGGDAYSDLLSGVFYEHFPSSGWDQMMSKYLAVGKVGVAMLNANNANQPGEDYQKMRFGLTSSLLGNGYYSYDLGDLSHQQLWWYDEYEVDLGLPLGAAVKLDNGVWRRDFERSIVLVNPTGQTVHLDFEDVFKRIQGSRNPEINNGEEIRALDLAGSDGIIIMKK